MNAGSSLWLGKSLLIQTSSFENSIRGRGERARRTNYILRKETDGDEVDILIKRCWEVPLCCTHAAAVPEFAQTWALQRDSSIYTSARLFKVRVLSMFVLKHPPMLFTNIAADIKLPNATMETTHAPHGPTVIAHLPQNIKVFNWFICQTKQARWQCNCQLEPRSAFLWAGYELIEDNIEGCGIKVCQRACSTY